MVYSVFGTIIFNWWSLRANIFSGMDHPSKFGRAVFYGWYIGMRKHWGIGIVLQTPQDTANPTENELKSWIDCMNKVTTKSYIIMYKFPS
jgi:hypothetical protein